MEDWRLYAILSALFAALTAIFGKIGVASISSDLATFIRTILILLISALFVSLNRSWLPFNEISNKTYLFLGLSGLSTGLSWLAYYKALQLGPVSRVAPVDKLSVVIAVVFSAVFLGETISLRAAIGTFLIGIGVVLLAL